MITPFESVGQAFTDMTYEVFSDPDRFIIPYTIIVGTIIGILTGDSSKKSCNIDRLHGNLHRSKETTRSSKRTSRRTPENPEE
jgi:hypothetical protein